MHKFILKEMYGCHFPCEIHTQILFDGVECFGVEARRGLLVLVTALINNNKEDF